MEITVLHLTGWTGTGKTTLLKNFSIEHPGSIQILTPAKAGQALEPSAADWDNHSAIAIDEVTSWDRESVAEGVASLESYAEQCGKKLILVSQAQEDLEHCSIVLRKAPVMIGLDGRQQRLILSFDGKRLTFSDTSSN